MALGLFDILSLVVIGIVLIIFLVLYIMVWKVGDLPLSHKVFYGGFFIPLSLLLFCSILFQLLPDYSLAFVIYVLISGQLLLIMISDAGGQESARKMRVGRIVLYSVGYAFGIIGILFLFNIIFMYIILFGLSSLSEFYADRMILFGLVGTMIFILSLWGFAREDRYGTGGRLKGTMFQLANILFVILEIEIIYAGLFSILDLLVWEQKVLHIHPDFNYITGVLYFPIGISLLILSVLKIRRDIRYRKQFY